MSRNLGHSSSSLKGDAESSNLMEIRRSIMALESECASSELEYEVAQRLTLEMESAITSSRSEAELAEYRVEDVRSRLGTVCATGVQLSRQTDVYRQGILEAEEKGENVSKHYSRMIHERAQTSDKLAALETSVSENEKESAELRSELDGVSEELKRALTNRTSALEGLRTASVERETAESDLLRSKIACLAAKEALGKEEARARALLAKKGLANERLTEITRAVQERRSEHTVLVSRARSTASQLRSRRQTDQQLDAEVGRLLLVVLKQKAVDETQRDDIERTRVQMASADGDLRDATQELQTWEAQLRVALASQQRKRCALVRSTEQASKLEKSISNASNDIEEVTELTLDAKARALEYIQIHAVLKGDWLRAEEGRNRLAASLEAARTQALEITKQQQASCIALNGLQKQRSETRVNSDKARVGLEQSGRVRLETKKDVDSTKESVTEKLELLRSTKLLVDRIRVADQQASARLAEVTHIQKATARKLKQVSDANLNLISTVDSGTRQLVEARTQIARSAEHKARVEACCRDLARTVQILKARTESESVSGLGLRKDQAVEALSTLVDRSKRASEEIHGWQIRLLSAKSAESDSERRAREQELMCSLEARLSRLTGQLASGRNKCIKLDLATEEANKALQSLQETHAKLIERVGKSANLANDAKVSIAADARKILALVAEVGMYRTLVLEADRETHALNERLRLMKSLMDFDFADAVHQEELRSGDTFGSSLRDSALPVSSELSSLRDSLIEEIQKNNLHDKARLENLRRYKQRLANEAFVKRLPADVVRTTAPQRVNAGEDALLTNGIHRVNAKSSTGVAADQTLVNLRALASMT